MKDRKPWSFCETPEEKCTMNYCDENGCQNRKRNYVQGNDLIADVSSMLVANGMPAFGTKEFNDMCSNFFGGKPKSN